MFIYYRGLLVGAKIIILMDNGKIVAIGSNDELYDKVPMYREIVDLQHLEGGEDE